MTTAYTKYANALPYGIAAALACGIPGKGVFIFSGISNPDPRNELHDVLISNESALGGNILHLDPTTGVVTDTGIAIPAELLTHVVSNGAPVFAAGGTRGACAFDAARGVIVIHFGIYQLPQIPFDSYDSADVISGVGAVPCRSTFEFDGTTITQYTNTIPRTSTVGSPWSTFDHSMGFDPDRNVMILYSGSSSGYGWAADNGSPTFTWNTTTHVWDVEPKPASTLGWAFRSASYNPRQNRTILFGGFGVSGLAEYKGPADPFDVLLDGPSGGPSDGSGIGTGIVYSPLRGSNIVKSNFATYTYTPSAPNPNPAAHQGFGTYTQIDTSNEPPVGTAGRPYRAVCYYALSLVVIGGQIYNNSGPSVGVTTSRDIYVLADPQPVSIAVTLNTTLLVSARAQLTALATLADSSVVDVTDIASSWVSSDPSVATVDATGRVHVLRVGPVAFAANL